MAHPELVDEVANELDTWPGVHIERHSPSVTVVRYEQVELGALDREQGFVELRLSPAERDAAVEHGEAEPAVPILDAETVRHNVRGPADVSAVLELFDRRYRDVRGEDDPFSSRDPS